MCTRRFPAFFTLGRLFYLFPEEATPILRLLPAYKKVQLFVANSQAHLETKVGNKASTFRPKARLHSPCRSRKFLDFSVTPRREPGGDRKSRNLRFRHGLHSRTLGRKVDDLFPTLVLRCKRKVLPHLQLPLNCQQ